MVGHGPRSGAAAPQRGVLAAGHGAGRAAPRWRQGLRRHRHPARGPCLEPPPGAPAGLVAGASGARHPADAHGDLAARPRHAAPDPGRAGRRAAAHPGGSGPSDAARGPRALGLSRRAIPIRPTSFTSSWSAGPDPGRRRTLPAADGQSVRADLAAQPPPQRPLAAQVLATLAQCCQEGVLRVNQFPGQVFVQADATLVVVPMALDAVRQRLATQGVRLPGNALLFNDLAAAGYLLGAPGQNVMKASLCAGGQAARHARGPAPAPRAAVGRHATPALWRATPARPARRGSLRAHPGASACRGALTLEKEPPMDDTTLATPMPTLTPVETAPLAQPRVGAPSARRVLHAPGRRPPSRQPF